MITLTSIVGSTFPYTAFLPLRIRSVMMHEKARLKTVGAVNSQRE